MNIVSQNRKFRLNERTMVEVGDRNPYILEKAILRKAIRGNLDSVMYKIKFHGQNSNYIPASFSVSKLMGRIHFVEIGCQFFMNESARKLCRWAVGK